MESQAEYGRKLMEEIQARSLEVAQKKGVTPELFWERVKSGMDTEDMDTAFKFVRLAGEYMGIKPAEKHEMKHDLTGSLMEIAVQAGRKIQGEKQGS